MSVRTAAGLLVVAGYLGFVAHTTAGTQCPVRELGPCARVHALLLGPPRPATTLPTIASPMRARDAAALPLRVASAATRVAVRP
jgi:hypothetical protein